MEGESTFAGDPFELPPALSRRLSHGMSHSISHGLSHGLARPRLVTKPGAGYVIGICMFIC